MATCKNTHDMLQSFTQTKELINEIDSGKDSNNKRHTKAPIGVKQLIYSPPFPIFYMRVGGKTTLVHFQFSALDVAVGDVP